MPVFKRVAALTLILLLTSGCGTTVLTSSVKPRNITAKFTPTNKDHTVLYYRNSGTRSPHDTSTTSDLNELRVQLRGDIEGAVASQGVFKGIAKGMTNLSEKNRTMNEIFISTTRPLDEEALAAYFFGQEVPESYIDRQDKREVYLEELEDREGELRDLETQVKILEQESAIRTARDQDNLYATPSSLGDPVNTTPDTGGLTSPHPNSPSVSTFKGVPYRRASESTVWVPEDNRIYLPESVKKVRDTTFRGDNILVRPVKVGRTSSGRLYMQIPYLFADPSINGFDKHVIVGYNPGDTEGSYVEGKIQARSYNTSTVIDVR